MAGILKVNSIESAATNGNITLDPDGTGNTIIASGEVGVGTTTPATYTDYVSGSNAPSVVVAGSQPSYVLADTDISGNDGTLGITKAGEDTVINNLGAGNVRISNNGSERLRVDNSGILMVGKTSTNYQSVGVEAKGNGSLWATADGNGPLIVVRKSSDGTIVQLYKDTAKISEFKVTDGDNLSIDCTSTNHSGLTFGEGNILPRKSGANNNGNIDLGAGSARFANLYATNPTIQTSDETEKQNISSLTSAEITAAKAISALFKTYKFRSKVAAEGDTARTHTGVIAQEVQTAMSDAGLDASKYAFWCSDTWWEADETYTDDDGAEQTHTKVYNTADEAPEGATQKTMLGIRYAELLAFIGAATEQRLADIETRLTALEE